jgi:hypothetical protein
MHDTSFRNAERRGDRRARRVQLGDERSGRSTCSAALAVFARTRPLFCGGQFTCWRSSTSSVAINAYAALRYAERFGDVCADGVKL